MAVQQNRKTRSKRGMRRAHDAIGGPTLTVDETSGETRRRPVCYTHMTLPTILLV